jgi:hypothetical protein
MRARGLCWLVTTSTLLFGCSTCGPDGSAVPFKRNEAKAAKTDPVAETKDAGSRARAPPGEEGPAGTAYPAQTASVELAGATLKRAEGAIRAALPYTADGDKAALLVTQDADGALALERSALRGGAWGAPARVAPLPMPAAEGAVCAPKAMALRALGTSYALVDAALACDTSAAPPAPSDSDVAALAAPSGPGARHLWIASLGAAPRLLQHVEIGAPASEGAARIEPALQSRDLDGDGRADLLLALDVLVGDQPPTRVELKLFDRAGGLAPGGDEPEKTLLAIADQAKDERKRNAGAALELARRALAVHAALCGESATSRLRIGGRGVPCGASLAAGRAATVLIAQLAGQGKVLQALELYRALDGREYRLLDNDRERARLAVHGLIDDRSLAFRKGPTLDAPPPARARRSAIAFIDEGHLLLRGTPARSYDLGSGEVAAVGMAADTSLTSPDGRFAVYAVVRSCKGYHVSIVNAAQAVAGIVTGPSVSEPLVLAAAPPAGARCPELSAEQRHDDGGLRVLDWTPQGLLLAREQTLWLLALDASATAQAPARELAKTDAPPRRPHSEQLTGDGRYLALPTPLGVAIYDRARDTTRLLAVPESPEPISDVALSPSGRSLALVRGRQIYIGQAAPNAPAAPAP